MAASSSPERPAASPSKGTDGGRPGTLAQLLRNCDRAALESALDKGDTWARSIINGNAGIMIDDLDAVIDFFERKLSHKRLRCVDPDLLTSYETIVRRVVANAGRSLFDEDAE